MRQLRALVAVIALMVAGSVARADNYTFNCNHCSHHLSQEGTGEGTCPECSHINVLAHCYYCNHVVAWKGYGQFNCPDCGKSQAVSSCIACNRVVIAEHWSGWWTCPYEDCGKKTYRFFCGRCGDPFMTNQEMDFCWNCK